MTDIIDLNKVRQARETGDRIRQYLRRRRKQYSCGFKDLQTVENMVAINLLFQRDELEAVYGFYYQFADFIHALSNIDISEHQYMVKNISRQMGWVARAFHAATVQARFGMSIVTDEIYEKCETEEQLAEIVTEFLYRYEKNKG